jgi:hypothetical protein
MCKEYLHHRVESFRHDLARETCRGKVYSDKRVRVSL